MNPPRPLGLPSGSAVKTPSARQEPQETWVRSLGQDDPLEEGMATHSSMPAWRIPWTKEPEILGYSSQGPKELIMTEAIEPACTPLTPSHKYCNTYKGHELVIKKPSVKGLGGRLMGMEQFGFSFLFLPSRSWL